MKAIRILALSLALLVASSVAFSPSFSLADLGAVVLTRFGAWTVDTSQNIQQDATLGGSITINKTQTGFAGPASGILAVNVGSAGTLRIKDHSGTDTLSIDENGRFASLKAFGGPVADFATLAGAGSTQTDAAAIAHVVSRVTGANGTVGVKLPGISTVTAGQVFYIINSNTTSALKYYSNASGETIDGQTGTTAVSLAAKLWAICFVYDASNWYCAHTVIPF